MTFAGKQRGLSLIGLLLLLGFIAFALSTAFKVVPHYIDYFSLRKVIETAVDNPSLGIESVDDFYSYVGKNMQVNTIRDVDLKQALRLKVENNRFVAHLDYEQREPLIFNVDLVMKFDKQFSVAKP
ncbi:hypothetical protein ASF84_01730 [Pseudomonas sp. Leaf127]|uniref:DUF4845 domain-containing protein n=1 Tax=Pseudomonas TaxID=286 RepID=UPI00070313C9|nr:MULTISPECIES: DUF4845 domain-containing protein [Pseudomonas]KQQ68262.1 hypothetical protein ASF84_01730 [Pseudomonas sp. Leaf127]